MLESALCGDAFYAYFHDCGDIQGGAFVRAVAVNFAVFQKQFEPVFQLAAENALRSAEGYRALVIGGDAVSRVGIPVQRVRLYAHSAVARYKVKFFALFGAVEVYKKPVRRLLPSEL